MDPCDWDMSHELVASLQAFGPAYWDLWVLEQSEFTSRLQWLPRELLEDLLGLVGTAKFREVPQKMACVVAARCGRLDWLVCVRAQDPPLPWDIWSCAHAAENGRLNILQWLRAQDPPCPWDEWTSALAEELDFIDEEHLRQQRAAGEELAPEASASLERRDLSQLYGVSLEEVTPAFVAKRGTIEAKRIQHNRNAARSTAQELYARNDARVGSSIREAHNTETSLPKHAAVRHILEGMGFAEGIHTVGVHKKGEIESAIVAYAPEFRERHKQYNTVLGKNRRGSPGQVDLKFLMQYLEKPLADLYKAGWNREYDRKRTIVALGVTLRDPG